MFKIIAIVFVVLIAALLIYAATKPDTFRVQRAISKLKLRRKRSFR